MDAVFRFASDPFAHCLAAFAFLGRVADLASTRFVTPRLRLEANPLARRLGWPFAVATLALALVAYLPRTGPALAFMIGVVSFLVAGSNMGGWAARVIGEDEMHATLVRAAGRGSALEIYGALAARALLTSIAGGALIFFYPDPQEWAWVFGVAVVLYAFALGLHSTLAVRRLRGEAQRRS